MRKVMIVGMAMTALLAANVVRAAVCQIVNGSFEDDEWITNITVKEPNGWDVNMPSDRFGGYVKKDWATDPNFNLTLFSLRFAEFDVNDMAILSQQVDLTGVDNITFDLKLDTYPPTNAWSPGKCSAVLLIDSDVVWESNSVGPDVRGEYFGQSYTVIDKYKDGQPHKLSLGMRVNVSEVLRTSYITQWDFIRCTVLCGGNPILATDFNRDCYVNLGDLASLAELWLDKVEPNDKYNLFGGDDSRGEGFISFLDFAFFADRWEGDMSRLGTFAEKWLTTVDADDQDNLFHGDDVLNPTGVINFFDLVKFANTWLESSYTESP